MTDRPNLLFVTVDCLRRDFTTEDYADTPFLDDFRESGTEYRQLYSTTSNTTPSVASLLTGTYSERNGVNSLREVELSEDVDTIAEVLGEAGYETAGLLTGPIVEETDLDRGFDRFDHRDKDRNLTNEWFDTAVEFVDSLSEPFFCYVHLWELHNPIDVPPEFDHPEYGDTPYARMLSALDRDLERFLDTVPEDTVVALHGDHGESISWRQSLLYWPFKLARDGLRWGLSLDTRGIERRINHAMDSRGPEFPDQFLEEGHGETVHDFMTNVPFVLNGPGIPAETVEAQCRQVDILPTLLDHVDVAIPEVDGESLLPPGEIEDRDAYMRACGPSLLKKKNWQRGIRTPEYKYVEYPDRDIPPELYDLEADESELDNVADDHPDVVARLSDKLQNRDLRSVDELDIDDHLKDLGYM